MGATLRPYQQEAVEKIHERWGIGDRSTLLVQATGTGKTVVMAKIAEDAVRSGGRVLLLAHRGELLEQAADKIKSFTGLACSVEKAEQTSIGAPERVCVGSVQTLMRENRLNRFSPDHFTHILVDECHHAVSDMYRNVLGYFDRAKVLGVTATADRADKQSLGKIFDSLAFEYNMPDAIRDGYLCPIKAQMVGLDIDISNVGMSAGDYNANELGDALEPYLEAIAEEMAATCLGQRRTVVFLPLIETSKKMCRILRAHGFRAAEVNGNSEDRAEVLADFAAGRYDVLCNSLLLTEGWDCPPVDCIVNLRPTRSRALYTQIVGRGTRLSPETGKTDLLLLDFLWQTGRLNLCHPANIVAKGDEQAEKMAEIIERDGEADLMETEKRAAEEIIKEREASIARELAAQRKKTSKLVDPLQFEMSIASEALIDYVPSFPWEMAPPSEKQISTLERRGIDPTQIDCAGKAHLIIDRLETRRKMGLCTPKQIRCLEKYGFVRVGEWSFDDASSMIARLAANRWHLPKDFDAAAYRP